MAYQLQATDDFSASFKKLMRKNAEFRKAVENKVRHVLEDPFKFKPLGAPLQGFRRVHVMRSFVIVYKIKESENAVLLVKLEHHDNAYEF